MDGPPPDNALLRDINTVWRRQIKAARLRKRKLFGQTAEKIWRFFGSSWNELYGPETDFPEFRLSGAEGAYFQPRLPLVGKYVFTMLPYILANIPNRLVSPRRLPIPSELVALAQQAAVFTEQVAMQGGMPPPISPVLQLLAAAAPMQAQVAIEDQTRCWLMQGLLQYLPGVYGLQGESEKALVEALSKGMGVVWHELVDGPTGELPGSFYDSIDNLLFDPDALRRHEAGWIARRRRQSVWEVAERFGLDPKELRATYRSWQSKAHDEFGEDEASDENDVDEANPEVRRADICVYYEVFSRIGLGQRFDSPGETLTARKDALGSDQVGPNCYLAIMPGMEFPLNLTPGIVGLGAGLDAFVESLRWELPTYENPDDPWPCSCIEFVPDTESPWATSPLLPALPLQVFMDQLWSFLMGGAARRSKSLVVVAKELEERLKDAIAEGEDMQIVATDASAVVDLAKLLHVVDFGRMNEDLWKLVPLTERAFEEFTGISSLLTHGGVGQTQPRSATEMDVRQERASSRPDDFADATERWQSLISSKEAQIARLRVGAATMAPLFGEGFPELSEIEAETYDPADREWEQTNSNRFGPLSQLWMLLAATDDPALAAAELSYTVEAGSGRRRNRQKMAADLQSIAQNVLPILMADYQMTMAAGQPDPSQINVYIRMVEKALEVPEVASMQLPVRQPPMPQPEGEGEGEEDNQPPSKPKGEP